MSLNLDQLKERNSHGLSKLEKPYQLAVYAIPEEEWEAFTGLMKDNLTLLPTIASELRHSASEKTLSEGTRLIQLNTGGAVETGWEASRRELETFERSGEKPHDAVRQFEQNSSDLAPVGFSVADDLAGLAHNLCEMSGEPEKPAKPKADHERKRGIGQKQDDHGQDHMQEYELSM